MDQLELAQLKAARKLGVESITFTKVNGARRTMLATLQPSDIPETGQTSTRVKDPNLLVVWDTEHSGWRTIKVDSIRTWNKEGDPVVEAPAPVIGGWQPFTQTQVPTANTNT